MAHAGRSGKTAGAVHSQVKFEHVWPLVVTLQSWAVRCGMSVAYTNERQKNRVQEDVRIDAYY